MSRIFLSHSSTDNFEAEALRKWLASEGWDDVFLDLDPQRGIAAGERWERALHQAANRCEAVVFLVSRNWLASGWCRKEYEVARGLNKKLFAVLIHPSTTISGRPAARVDGRLAGGSTSGAARISSCFRQRCRVRTRSGMSRFRSRASSG